MCDCGFSFTLPDYNPIKIMSGRVFDKLRSLEFVGLRYTRCMNHLFVGNNTSKAIIPIVERKCGYPEINHYLCGIDRPLRAVIKSGKVTQRGQYPFLVALIYRENKKYFCGGNLITSRHVLTGDFLIVKQYDG